jgi:hypothetical protein
MGGISSHECSPSSISGQIRPRYEKLAPQETLVQGGELRSPPGLTLTELAGTDERLQRGFSFLVNAEQAAA